MSSTVPEESTISKHLEIIENIIVTLALGIMIVVIFLQIVFRYWSAVSIPGFAWLTEYIRDAAMFLLPWTEEVARYTMLWAVFIGAGMGAKTGVHVGVDAFVRLLPPKILRYVTIFSGLCSIAFCLSLTILGVVLLDIMWETGQRSSAVEIPMVWAYLCVPVGGFLTALRFYQAMAGKLRSLQAAGEAAA